MEMKDKPLIPFDEKIKKEGQSNDPCPSLSFPPYSVHRPTWAHCVLPHVTFLSSEIQINNPSDLATDVFYGWWGMATIIKLKIT